MKWRVPDPAVPPWLVAVTVCVPSLALSVTVSVASEVAGRTTSTLTLDALAESMKALPVPPPLVSVIELGAAGAILMCVLCWALSPPSQL